MRMSGQADFRLDVGGEFIQGGPDNSWCRCDFYQQVTTITIMNCTECPSYIYTSL